MTPSNRDVVLIGGLPRSGGTMLSFMLDGIPGVYTLPFELDVAGPKAVRLAEGRRLPARLRKRLAGVLRAAPGAGLPSVDALLDRYRELLHEAEIAGTMGVDNVYALQVVAFYAAIGVPVADSPGALIVHSPHWMTRAPLTVVRAEVVGRVVYLRRRNLDWLRSYVGHMGCAEPPAIPLIDLMLRAKGKCDLLASYLERAFPERVLVADYESLADEPHEALQRLCGRLGLQRPPDHDPRPTLLGSPVGSNSSLSELRSRTDVIPSHAPRVGILTAEIVDYVRERHPDASWDPHLLRPLPRSDKLEAFVERTVADWRAVRSYHDEVLRTSREISALRAEVKRLRAALGEPELPASHPAAEASIAAQYGDP